MSLKAIAAKIFASRIHRKNQKWIKDPIKTQEQVFAELLAKAAQTQFGRDHDFSNIKTHGDFVKKIPIR
ncbi:MAG: GH3 auxin-responsive promoter family protein, partial [Flavobacteriaceae bacterium]